MKGLVRDDYHGSVREVTSSPAGSEGEVVVPLLVTTLARARHWSQEADTGPPGLHTAQSAVFLGVKMVVPGLTASVPEPGATS